jgi:viroplasmin and RNaseH domain-containing protein
LDIDELPGDAGVKQTLPQQESEMSINQNIKGLKGREYQALMRIIREFNKGKINRLQATQMLQTGYGLTNEDMNIWLGEEEEQQTI